MKIIVKNGNIFKENTDIMVNPWNRNIIPWWLLLPQGVSGSLKKLAGLQPFKDLSKIGPIPLGEARFTKSYKLNNFKGIIHVAGINMFWFATEYSIRNSIKNSLDLLIQKNYSSIVFPLIGSGSGNRSKEKSKRIILDELNILNKSNKYNNIEVIVIEYKPNNI